MSNAEIFHLPNSQTNEPDLEVNSIEKADNLHFYRFISEMQKESPTKESERINN